MEINWKERIAKYGYGIDVDKAIKDKLVEFVETTIYLTQDLTDNDLWYIFQEQFEGFTVESFKKIRTDIRSKLQRYLLKRGIYIGRRTSRITISKLLFKVT